MGEKVNSVEAKIKELYTLQETLNKLQVAILAKYLHKIATYQELR